MNPVRSPWLVLTLLPLALAALAAPASAQVGKGTKVQGRVVRVQGPNQFIVRTKDNREVTFYAGPKTRYLMGKRVLQFSDLREGATIDALYDVTEGRNVVSSVTFAETATPPSKPPATKPEKDPIDDTEVPGKELEMQGTVSSVGEDPSRLIVVATDGKGRVFYLDKRRDVKIRYQVEGGKRVVTSVTFAAQPPAPVKVDPAKEGKRVEPPAGKADEGTAVQGTVYKVAGENQFIIRTADGEEVVLHAQPQTTYRFGNVTARFADLRPGMEIRAVYDVRDRRNIVRSVLSIPKGGK